MSSPDETYIRLLNDLQTLMRRVEGAKLISAFRSAGIWPASCLADSANHWNRTANGRTMMRTNP